MSAGWRHSPAALIQKGLYLAVVAAGVVIFGFPLFWMVRGALISQALWLKVPLVWVPSLNDLSLDAFRQIFASTEFRMATVLLNTLLIALLTSALNVMYNCMAGFALAKMRFPGKNIILPALFITLMVPMESMMISLYLIITNAGLANTLAGIIFPMSAGAFGIILMWRFFATVPDEIIEAAIIDGADWGAILFKIAMPLATPAIATIAVLSFLGGWESFLWPMIITDPQSRFDVLQKVIANATLASGGGGTMMTQWPYLMAAALVSSVPVIILFLVGQKYFVSGLSTGSVKG